MKQFERVKHMQGVLNENDIDFDLKIQNDLKDLLKVYSNQNLQRFLRSLRGTGTNRPRPAPTGPDRHRPIQTGTGPAPTCLDRHQSRAGLCRSISSL